MVPVFYCDQHYQMLKYIVITFVCLTMISKNEYIAKPY